MFREWVFAEIHATPKMVLLCGTHTIIVHHDPRNSLARDGFPAAFTFADF